MESVAIVVSLIVGIYLLIESFQKYSLRAPSMLGLAQGFGGVVVLANGIIGALKFLGM